MQKISTTLDIDDKSYEYLYEQYHKLLYTITRNISGDRVMADPEDVFQELLIKLIEGTKAYSRRENKPIEDCLEDPIFHKYIKTCLWNYKNCTGSHIAKRYHINTQVSISEYEEIFLIPDNSFNKESHLALEELKERINSKQKDILFSVLQDHTLMKPNGQLNIARLSNMLDLPWNDTKKEVSKMARLIGDEF